MKIFYFLFVILIFEFRTSLAQYPSFSKTFVTKKDSISYRDIKPIKSGFSRVYMTSEVQIRDIDTIKSKFVSDQATALLCFEDSLLDGKKVGLSIAYLIDSEDNSRRYKLYEQNYSNDKLNGEWRTYSLNGTLVSSQSFKNDSLDGVSRFFGIDGNKITSEIIYFNGQNWNIRRLFYENGKVMAEAPYLNGKLNGLGIWYYESGSLQEVAELNNGALDGTRKYYYPNGQLWMEEIYKGGKNWTIIANYTDKGERRNAGTLRDGNGTIIYYHENGNVREIKSFINGDQINSEERK